MGRATTMAIKKLNSFKSLILRKKVFNSIHHNKTLMK